MSCRSSVYATANSALAHSHNRTFIIRRLDGVEQEVSVDKKAVGEELMDKACKSIGLLEKDYFGLQYRDKNGDHLWLNLRNPLHEQVPHGPRSLVEMRVKFFVQPQKLMQVVTRFHFYRHLRKELILGRLRSPALKATYFTALIAQIDKGDYHPSFEYRHKVPCDSVDTDTFVTRVRREHHLLMGTPSEVAVEKFLNEAAALDHYGVEMYHTLSSSKGKHIIVGVGPECIYVYSGPHMDVQKRFSYASVQYTAFHARKFTAVIENSHSSQIEFEMKSRGAAQALYRAVTEFHTFFQRDAVGSMVRDAGFCKSLIGTFKGQTPDRFYFDVIRTHKQVVDHLWPMMHPNSPLARRPPAALPSTTSLSSQRSTRSLPSGRHHRINRQAGSMPRSVSTDNSFRHVPPNYHLPPPTPVHRPNAGIMRRGSDRSAPPTSPFFYHTHLQPPPSPFNPYASNIEENSSDSDDQSVYVSGESDTYVCMRGSETLSIRRSSDHSVEGSETYVNSAASDVSSASLDGRIPSPPPVYSEVDPHRDRMRSPAGNFSLDPSALTMGEVINEEDTLNFDASAVLARTRELESELQRLRTAMTCRLCNSNPIGATFCPCGHTVCCYGCATRLNNCLECHQPVNGVQKMLLA